MNTTASDANPDEHTTILHLNQFAPQPVAESTTPAGQEGVTVFIKKAAAEVVQQEQLPIVVSPENNGLPPEKLLGAISYCYAKGVYGSEDIERKMNQDKDLAKGAEDQLPTAETIRRFRRRNRHAIKTTLEKAIKAQRQKEKSEAIGIDPSAATTPAAAGEGETTRMFVREEAETRLNNAIIMDENDLL